MQRKLIEGAVSPLFFSRKEKTFIVLFHVTIESLKMRNVQTGSIIGGELDYDTKVSN